MKERFRLATLVAVSAVASSASADAALLTGITYDVSGQDEVSVQVMATGALEEPRIRTQRGQIRVWFPNVDNNPRVQVPGDGDVFAEIGLRPGVADTAVLDIRLVHRAALRRGDVRFERNAMGGVIRLARGDVAPLPSPADGEGAEAAAEADEASEANTAAATPSPTAADRDEPEAARAPRAAEANEEDAEPAEPAAGTPLFASRDQDESEAGALGTAASGANLGLLALISLLLGAVYLFLRAMNKGRKITSDDDIHVVATKRLGPRDQLVVVRALGQDHLIAMHRGNAQLLSSSPVSESDDGVEPGTSILDRLREKADADTVKLSGEASTKDKFGAQLLSLTAIRKRIEDASSEEREQVESDAVAGLKRLRRAAGMK